MSSRQKGILLFLLAGILPLLLALFLVHNPIALYISLGIFMIAIWVLGLLFVVRFAQKVGALTTALQQMAEGEADLTKRLRVYSMSDELGRMAHWFNAFLERLEKSFIQVKSTSDAVNNSILEVASGGDGLAQSSQEQASAIEEVAATIEEMSSAIKQNAANAESGRDKVKATVSVANATAAVSEDLIRRMDEMSAASKKIGDIIVTVNEVAFQTNLLALNAAVEAARAGEHGKGFAVVAEEVRALAQRSADAARQIKALIEDTVSKIMAGDEMVKKSGESIAEIISHIEELSQTMDEIAASSAEQAAGVDEVNRAIAQIDATTQQNATTVEELSSAAEAMKSEAQSLDQSLRSFKVSTTKKSEAPRKKAIPAPLKTTVRPARTASAPPAPAAGGGFDNTDFEEF
ncbi:MAG TPA: methyl-accepting chemotaxis protein [Deltaproteobacteria bacterium]|nr:methyl-accepting chemotaxis protein [Deltaproteobacteria bacterium]